MIFFISKGRIGNELFQFAFLKSVSKKNEMIITLDMNNLDRYFETDLNNFNLEINTISKKIFKLIFKFIFKNFLVKLKLISFIYQNKTQDDIPSSTYSLNKGLLPITYVNDDFFQSEKFFDKNNFSIVIKDDYLNQAKSFIKRAPKNSHLIFIHVRRGDYLNEVFNGKTGINLSLNYYLNSIDYFNKKLANPFFIFLSDDPEFVEIAYDWLENKFISYNSQAVDLAIMSLCEYGIMANSSFSWWGGFFMKNRKEVICPKYWYGWKSGMESHIDIQPNWASIKE